MMQLYTKPKNNDAAAWKNLFVLGTLVIICIYISENDVIELAIKGLMLIIQLLFEDIIKHMNYDGNIAFISWYF